MTSKHQALITTTTNHDSFIETALNSVSAANTKRAYSRCLRQFLTWIQTQTVPRLERAAVQRYRVVLESRGHAPATINQTLAAIRTLAREAGAQGLIPGADALAIEKIRNVRRLGRRTGTWLSASSANAFLSIPDRNTLRGKRDLCLLVSCPSHNVIARDSSNNHETETFCAACDRGATEGIE